jgi:hypothetical protein
MRVRLPSLPQFTNNSKTEGCDCNARDKMKNEFIPYEQALELKQLGFDEPCFKKYIAGCLWSSPTTHETYQKIHPNSSDSLAPLYQQAFRWFREEYVLDSIVQPTYSTKYQYRVFKVEAKSKVQVYGDYMSKEFNTYEEAELACLKKLIEIVKSKNNTP